MKQCKGIFFVTRIAVALPFESLSEYVEALEQTDQLRRVKTKVSPNLEIAEIMRRLMYAGDQPAVLFENVEGSSMQVLGNAFSSMKLARNSA